MVARKKSTEKAVEAVKGAGAPRETGKNEKGDEGSSDESVISSKCNKSKDVSKSQDLHRRRPLISRSRGFRGIRCRYSLLPFFFALYVANPSSSAVAKEHPQNPVLFSENSQPPIMTVLDVFTARARTASYELRKSWANEPKSITARTTPGKYAMTWRRSPYLILPALFAAAVYCLGVQGAKNGLFPQLTLLAQSQDSKYPGTEELLLRRYTGLKAVDMQLLTLVGFFAPVVDHGRMDMTLFSLFGLGQFGAAWTVFHLESLRAGNHRRWVSWIGTYGFFVQNFSFAVSTPLYLLLHLLTSPVATPFPSAHASSVIMVSPYDLAVLPISVVIGYFIPSILMLLPAPGVVSLITHQQLIAFWQPFPLWVVVTQWTLRRLYKLASAPKATKATLSGTVSPPSATYLSSVGRLYAFVMFICIITHFPVLLIALLPAEMVPSIFPALQTLARSTFWSIYLPPLPLLSQKISSLAEGCFVFLQWDVYIGSAASLVWGVVLYRNASVERQIVDPTTSLPVYRELLSGERYPDRNLTRNLAFKILTWTFFAGPIGALTMMLWQRDAIVKQKIKQGI